MVAVGIGVVVAVAVVVGVAVGVVVGIGVAVAVGVGVGVAVGVVVGVGVGVVGAVVVGVAFGVVGAVVVGVAFGVVGAVGLAMSEIESAESIAELLLSLADAASLGRGLSACQDTLFRVCRSHEALRKERDEACEERDDLEAECEAHCAALLARERERDELRAKLDAIKALTWDPKARGLGETLPRDITPAVNRLLRQILGEDGA